MTLTAPRNLAAVLAAFAVALAAFAVTRGATSAPPAPALGAPRPDGTTTDATISSLQAEIRAGRPREAALADAYLQKARETGDLAYHARAEALLRRALACDPHDAGAVDEQRVRLERAGGESPRAAGQAQRPAEVMARRGQRAELDDGTGVVRVARQRLSLIHI